jgi:hypothetical protein
LVLDCIFKFEQTICEKANKTAFYDFENKFCKDYITKEEQNLLMKNIEIKENERM